MRNFSWFCGIKECESVTKTAFFSTSFLSKKVKYTLFRNLNKLFFITFQKPHNTEDNS